MRRLEAPGAQRGEKVGVVDHAGPERAGDPLHRNVVVGRAHPARGEDQIVSGGEEADLGGDRVRVVRDDHHPTERDSLPPEQPREVVGVRVRRLSGEQFVSDDAYRGGLALGRRRRRRRGGRGHGSLTR